MLEVAQVGPPVALGRVPDLGSIDDRPELFAPLNDRGHGSTGVMNCSGDGSIVELTKPVPARGEDARHLLMLPPRRGKALPEGSPRGESRRRPPSQAGTTPRRYIRRRCYRGARGEREANGATLAAHTDGAADPRAQATPARRRLLQRSAPRPSAIACH